MDASENKSPVSLTGAHKTDDSQYTEKTSNTHITEYTNEHQAAPDENGEVAGEKAESLNDIDVRVRDKKGRTALMEAAARDDSEAIKRLLALGSDVDARDSFGWTALLIAAHKTKNPDVADLLLQAGADATLQNDAGNNALFYAKMNGYLKGTDFYKRLVNTLESVKRGPLGRSSGASVEPVVADMDDNQDLTNQNTELHSEGQMDLLHNPFYLLGVSTRDDRETLLEAADKRGRFDGSEERAAALDILLNPRKRLSAEVAWLTKDDPSLLRQTLDTLKEASGRIEFHFDTPQLDRANIIASVVAARRRFTPEDLAQRIRVLAEAFDCVDGDDLLLRINENRARSGFPAVGRALLEEELEQRRRFFRQILKGALDKLPTAELVRTVAMALISGTEGGSKPAPTLVDDLFDPYEQDAQLFLEKEKENVETTLEKMRKAAQEERPEEEILEMAEELKQILKNWIMFAEPVRGALKVRGLVQSDGERMEWTVRSAGIDMFYKYGLLRTSVKLNKDMRDIFSYLPGLYGQLERDARELLKLEKEKKKRDMMRALIAALVIGSLPILMYIFGSF